MFEKLLETFGNQTSVGQSRTATTNPLQWTLAIILLGLVGLAVLHVPAWLLIFSAVCVGVVLLVLVYAFIFLLHNDREALRSEKYLIDKLAIQSRLSGDSDAGLRKVPDIPTIKGIPVEEGRHSNAPSHKALDEGRMTE